MFGGYTLQCWGILRRREAHLPSPLPSLIILDLDSERMNRWCALWPRRRSAWRRKGTGVPHGSGSGESFRTRGGSRMTVLSLWWGSHGVPRVRMGWRMSWMLQLHLSLNLPNAPPCWYYDFRVTDEEMREQPAQGHTAGKQPGRTPRQGGPPTSSPACLGQSGPTGPEAGEGRAQESIGWTVPMAFQIDQNHSQCGNIYNGHSCTLSGSVNKTHLYKGQFGSIIQKLEKHTYILTQKFYFWEFILMK